MIRGRQSVRFVLASLVVGLAAVPTACSVVPPAGGASTTVQRSQARSVGEEFDTYATELRQIKAKVDRRVRLRTAEGAPENELASLATAQGWFVDILSLADSASATLRASPSGYLRVIQGFKDSRAATNKTLRGALPEGGWTFVKAWLQQENQIYVQHLHPVLEESFIQDHAVRQDVFERKYFSDDVETKGNFLEGWINSRVSFLRSTESAVDDGTWYRQNGVSQFETTARVEPLVLFDSDKNTAVLGALGLTYHFMPTYEPVRFEPRPEEGFLSDWIRRTGIRAGLGVQTEDDAGADFIAGAALQVRSFSLWGVYNFEQEEFFVGVGISDFEWLSRVMPTFDD